MHVSIYLLFLAWFPLDSFVFISLFQNISEQFVHLMNCVRAFISLHPRYTEMCVFHEQHASFISQRTFAIKV